LVFSTKTYKRLAQSQGNIKDKYHINPREGYEKDFNVKISMNVKGLVP